MYIKREDAIRVLADYLLDRRGTSTANHMKDASVILNRVPSADVVELSECDNCEVRDESYIEAVSANGYDHGFEDGYSKGKAEAEPKQGEWIVDWYKRFRKCTNCNKKWRFDYGSYDSNFCPNCGARMFAKEGASDED